MDAIEHSSGECRLSKFGGSAMEPSLFVPSKLQSSTAMYKPMIALSVTVQAVHQDNAHDGTTGWPHIGCTQHPALAPLAPRAIIVDCGQCVRNLAWLCVTHVAHLSPASIGHRACGVLPKSSSTNRITSTSCVEWAIAIYYEYSCSCSARTSDLDLWGSGSEEQEA
jgi:hypothetical protein